MCTAIFITSAPENSFGKFQLAARLAPRGSFVYMTYEVYDTYVLALELRLLAPQISALFVPLNSRLCDRQQATNKDVGSKKWIYGLFFGTDLVQITV
jgi:hypothetical protein